MSCSPPSDVIQGDKGAAEKLGKREKNNHYLFCFLSRRSASIRAAQARTHLLVFTLFLLPKTIKLEEANANISNISARLD